MVRTIVAAVIIGLSAALPARADGDELFRRQVAPVFERHCVGCHQGPRPKGGLALTTPEGLLAGGESGPAVVAGKPDESRLVEHISGERPEMPKDAAPLAAAPWCLAMSVVCRAGGTDRRAEPPSEGNIEAAASTTRTTRSQRRILARCIPPFYPNGPV